MRSRKTPIVVFVLLAFSHAAWAQTELDSLLVDPLEALMDEPDEEVVADPSALLDDLSALLDHPLDLNASTAWELSRVPGLTARMATAIVDYRTSRGPFRAVAELLAVDGFSVGLLDEVRPFVRLTPSDDHERAASADDDSPSAHRRFRASIQQRLQRRLDRQRGYLPVPDSLIGTNAEPSRYLGSPVRIYTRAQVSLGSYSANVTLEKDPGEPFTWDPESGFFGYDFVSLHVAARELGPIRKLVLGDFVVEFGQGVALWRPSGFGKGVEPVRSLMRRGRGIRPYASTDENRFFRGAAVSVEPVPGLRVSAFGSRRMYDARFAEVDTLGVPSPGATVISLPQAGLHRTPSEIAAKNNLGQSLVGGALELQRTNWTLGAAGYTARFDHPIAGGSQPHQHYSFSGDHVSMLSVFGQYVGEQFHAFGEVAIDRGGVMGGVLGVETTVGPAGALFMLRHYPQDFVSLHGYAFGDRNGATQNEFGAYLGLEVGISPTLRVMAYADQFRSPWARFGVPRPSTGSDYRFALEHRPRPWLTVHAQGRLREREVGTRIPSSTGGELEALEPERRSSIRLQVDFVAARNVRLRSRVEGSRYHRSAEDPRLGYMVFHDLRWLATSTVQIDARLTYFETDGFEARLYQFESDLLGVMTNALLYGRGARGYLVLTLRPRGLLDRFDARLKFASTTFRDRHVVGSGLDQIDGNRVRDVGLQVRYRI